MSTQNGRGQQGRPTIEAAPKRGEDRVLQILGRHKNEIMSLFANESNPEAMFKRASALSVAAYRQAQRNAEESASALNKAPTIINEESAVAVCLWAMQRKLDPGTDVYLVPYGGIVKPILSPQGVIKLVFRSGYVKAIHPPRVVFRGEPFEYELGDTPYIKHKKANKRPLGVKERGQVAANPQTWELIEYAYCVVELKDGFKDMDVFDKADLAYYRSLSPSADSKYGLWAKFPAEACQKTVLKRMAKWIPQESEISMILMADDTDQGIDIPDEFMKAVGARVGKELVNEVAEPKDGATGAGDGAHETPAMPAPGDPAKLHVPGKSGTMPTIAAAPDALLKKWVGILQDERDKGAWDDGQEKAKFRDQNLLVLATMRAELAHRAGEIAPEDEAMLPSDAGDTAGAAS